MQSLKKFSPESIRAIVRNPNIDLQSIGIYSKSDIQHHIRTISQSPIQHIRTHHLLDENTYEQIIEQPHTTAFQSQNNNFFSPR